jgi:triphosphatase
MGGSTESLFRLVEIPAFAGNSGKGLRKSRAPGNLQHAKLKPLKASAPRLDPSRPSSEALRDIVEAATGQILHNWAVVLDNDDPEGTHEMRIGVRRLRSALKVMRPVADDQTLREFSGKARDLGRLLGELRDFDVLIMDIAGPAAAKRDGDPGLASLMAALDSNRTDCRARVRAELQDEQLSDLKLKLANLHEDVEGLTATRHAGKARTKPIASLTGKALEKLWDKVETSGRRLKTLTALERHEMRKDVKNMRYASELLAPVYRTKDVRRFTAMLQRLQDAFGYLNDVALAESLKFVAANGTADGQEWQQAIGYVIGWHTARAEHAMKDARSGWKRLERSPQFWA